MEPHLIDRIYESAFVSERCRAFWANSRTLSAQKTGFLFVSRDEIHNWTSPNAMGSRLWDLS